MSAVKKILFSVVLLGLVMACDQPFQAGLGKKVDIVPPKFTSDITPTPGSYLKGTVIFSGTVWDDVEVISVQASLGDGYWKNAVLDKSSNTFFFTLDTTTCKDGEDGPIEMVFRVTDNSNKSTDTSVLSYTIKNLPPQIEMTLPVSIKDADFDRPDLNNWLKDYPLYDGYDLMGMASDALGIKQGYPQIMFWPADLTNVDANGLPLASDTKYGVWYPLEVPREEDGLKATKFSWPMKNLIEYPAGSGNWRMPGKDDDFTYLPSGSGINYRFRIKIVDMAGMENYYPNRVNNTAGLEPGIHPNQYIEVKYSASDVPAITLMSFNNDNKYYSDHTGTKDLIVKMKVSCKTNIEWVRARLSGTSDLQNFESGSFYTVTPDSTDPGGRGTYILTIPAADFLRDPNINNTQGTYFLHLGAKEVEGNRINPLTYTDFVYDPVAPELIFDRPVIGTEKKSGNLKDGSYAIYWTDWVTGQITIGGINNDTYGVEKLYYHIGTLGDDNALDDTAREAIYNAAGWIDTALDTKIPANKWSGSVYAWSYTDNFNGYKSDPSLIEENITLTTTGKPQFYLPFYVKAIDRAGNQRIVQYKLFIDPIMDIPRAYITSPTEQDKVGGEVRVSGTALDNNWIHSVQIRINVFKQNGSLDYYYNYRDSQGNLTADALPRSSLTKNEEGWLTAKITGSTGPQVPWFYVINSDGKLTPPVGVPSRQIKIEVRAVDIEIGEATHSIPNLIGDSAVRNIEFDANVPSISNPKITQGTLIRDYYEGIRVAGTFTIKTTVSVTPPATGAAITYVKVRISGQTSFTDLITNDTAQNSNSGAFPHVSWRVDDPQTQSSGRIEKVLTFTVNSTAIANMGYGKSGPFMLELQVIDNSNPAENKPYTAGSAYTLGVDNAYPTTTIDTQYNAVTSNFYVSGTAKDYDPSTGTVYGLERVLVYFEKGGDFYNPRGIKIGQTDDFYASGKGSVHSSEWAVIPQMTSYRVKTGGTADTPVFDDMTGKFPLLKQRSKNGNTGDVWESPHAMVIDTQELSEDTDLDGDGTKAEMWQGMVDKVWRARLDTHGFDDGIYTVHYIVMDQAGNATHYAEDIRIGNHRPVILDYNLGTDIDGSGGITPWTNNTQPGEYMKNPWTVGDRLENNKMEIKKDGKPTYQFTVRNNRFGITLDASDGNGQKRYKISYVTRNTTPVASTAMEKGKVYTIAAPGNTEWFRYGAPPDTGTSYAGTTFVATGPAKAGTGTVYQYDYCDPILKRGTEISGTIETGTPVTVEFTDFTHIPDTIAKGGNSGGNPEKMACFIIKVYDTLTGGAEAEQLAHAALVMVDIHNTDEDKPTVKIDPFFWNNKDDNSLYDNSKANGHIELEGDLPAAFNGSSGLMDRDPKVSGKISFRGTVSDNNTIGAIYFKIDGFTDAGAKPGNGTATGYYQAAEYSNGAWVNNGITNRFNYGWQFTVDTTTEIHDQSGHRVNWRLDFDTSFIKDVAALDKALTVIARDIETNTTKIPPGPNYSTTASYRVDIVPYITDIQTPLRTDSGLKGTNIRSADGKYSIIQGNNSGFITVEGFNLKPTGDNVFILSPAYPYDPSSTPTVSTIAPKVTHFSAANIASKYTSFTMKNDSAHSGYLAVFTNGIGSLNNINKNEALGSYKLKLSTSGNNTYELKPDTSNGSDEENMPNREADRYITKNITLTDDRYLQFFAVKKTDVKNGYNPVMLMNGNNPVFGYLDMKGGPKADSPNGAGMYQEALAMPQRGEFKLDDGSKVYKEYLIKASNWDGMGMARDDSGRYIHATTYNRDGAAFHLIYDRYAELYPDAKGWGSGTMFKDYLKGGGNVASLDNNNAIALETVNFKGLVLDRYQYPKLIAKGNSRDSFAAYYMAYYDNGTGQLVFRNFRIGETEADVGTSNRRLSNTGSDQKGSGSPYNNPYTNIEENIGHYAIINSVTNESEWNSNEHSFETGRLIVPGGASNHFDMAVTSGNIVVIAYYDETAGQLKVKYSSSVIDGMNPTQDINWRNSPVNLPLYTGMYVSMVMDRANGLHIAAFDAGDSDLKYIFIPDVTQSAYKAVTVDQYGAVGNWTDIKLHPQSGKPYIAYYNATEAGTRESIKMACLKDDVPMWNAVGDVKAGVDKNGYTTGKWEYRTVPAFDPPQGGSPKFQKVNLGFTTQTDGYRPVLGYLGTYIEFSCPVGE